MIRRADLTRPSIWLLAAVCLPVFYSPPVESQGTPSSRGSPGTQGSVGSQGSRGSTASKSSSQPSAAVRDLQRNIDALLAAPALDSGTWGVVVKSVALQDTLYSRNGGKLLLPASNMKVLTLAAAADRLGWDFSFETRLVGAGPIEEGILQGDLVVVGSGDPSLDDWDGAGTALFQSWAASLKASGVHAINGRIIGDDDSFDDDPWGAGWAWDDLDRSFATGVGALQFNQNTAQLRITAGPRAGDPAMVTIGPSGSGLSVRNQLTTGDAKTSVSIAVRRRLDSPALELRGSLPAGTGPFVRNVAVHNPTEYFVSQLRDALIAAGIDVLGAAVDIDDIDDPPSRARGAVLVTHRSPPLSTLAGTMMKLSQNLYAETLLKAMGTLKAVGGLESGRTAVLSVLQAWGIPSSGVSIADGSGLSTYDLLTPDALVAILTHVAQDSRLRDPFHAALPVAGRDGTLAQRLKGTPAEGNVRAKTGSLANARAMSGYVQSATAEPLVFSIIVNNFGVASEAVEKTMDAIIVSLARFSRR